MHVWTVTFSVQKLSSSEIQVSQQAVFAVGFDLCVFFFPSESKSAGCLGCFGLFECVNYCFWLHHTWPDCQSRQLPSLIRAEKRPYN